MTEGEATAESEEVELIAAAQAEKASYFSITETTRQAFRRRAAYYLDLFGASGRG